MQRFKQLYFLILFLLITATGFSQTIQPSFPDSLFSTYYLQRVSLFRTLPQTKADIVFLGNSITDGGEWAEMFADLKVKNRGISGDVTSGVLNRLDEVYTRLPDKIFLLIGINDLARNVSPDSVVKNILWINALIKEKSPETKLYIQSLFPVNEKFGKFGGHTNKKTEILKVNKLLFDSAARYGYNFIDVFSALVDSTGRMKAEYTNDGLHLTGQGYTKWKDVIYNKIYDLPALIPLPQKVFWTNEKLLLKNYTAILLTQQQFKNEAVLLQQYLATKNIRIPIRAKRLPGESVIELKMQDVITGTAKDEAYQLTVSKNNILINAATAHGLFNALQTFKQLTVGTDITAGEITDWPAFAWRGFMVDVGRNYQSVQQLKQQIDVMAAYKLNIFHFHLTEDIAWRLQSRLYPQLTADSNMLRNPGDYYTLEEVKDLVQYCKERFITLIPEIDMPGHSAAFKRAMSVDMQSVQGLIYCKNIITEVCKELDVPYIHIGGDEVKITNKDFLPEIAALIKSLGKKVIAWDPGGVLPKGTVLQMWNGQTLTKPGMSALDSRHLYVNHHDPIDGVVSVFNHMICDVSKGDSEKLGAIACVWPDRRISKEEDILTMNPVFPEMLALAERSWKGGGWKKYLSDIDKPGTERYEAFTEFEARLLDHQQLYFASLPFPYVKQSNIHWKLIGPFNNQGDLTKVFAPETHTIPDNASFTAATSVYGGTVFLRHFWAPMIGSHLPDPKENTTYYAFTQIFSAYEQNIGLWISFYNISRSNNTATPDSGKWDNRESKIWLNNKEIPAPLWSKPGRKNKGMETPLIDEGYEYRRPTTVTLQKGWNTVLLKLPVSSFKSADWQSPVKWMFSCMPVAEKKGMPVFPDGISIDPSGVHR